MKLTKPAFMKKAKLMRKRPLLKSLLFVLSSLVIFIFSLSQAVYAQSLESLIDRTQITIEETVNLTVKYSGGQARGRPDFSALEKQFDILSQNQSSQFRSINGRSESFTEWHFVLGPKSQGTLFIPAFEYNGAKSAAKTIKVTPPGAKPAGQIDSVFIETLVDKKEAFVQEQVKLSYRLYYAVNVDSLEAEPLELEGALIEQLPEARYRREVDGRMYNVLEYNYAIFPQRSEPVDIPALTWGIRIPIGGSSYSLFDRGRFQMKRLRTGKKSIQIKPMPSGFPANATWLPAKSLDIAENWSRNPSTFKIGEPITRELKITADGLTASQLPTLSGFTANTQSIKYYADQPNLDNQPTSVGLASSRTESAAVVITQSGETTIPAIKIPWWDIDNNQLRYAELPARKVYLQSVAESPNNPRLDEQQATESALPSTLEDNNNPGAAQQAYDGENKGVSWLWIVASALLSLLCSALCILWIQERNRNQEALYAQSETQRKINLEQKRAFAHIQKQCQSGAAAEVRHAILAWAKVYWPNDHVSTLDVIGRKTNPEISQQLKALDQAIFSDQNHQASDLQAINLNALYLSLEAWLKTQKSKHNDPRTLKPLYAPG